MENIRTYEQAVSVTADWWVSKSFFTPMNQDMGEPGMLQNMMNQVSMMNQGEVKLDQIEIFKETLTKSLMEFEHNQNKNNILLSVDYDPSKILYEACVKSKISTKCLPCKSHSYIDENNSVIVKMGWGSKLDVI